MTAAWGYRRVGYHVGRAATAHLLAGAQPRQALATISWTRFQSTASPSSLPLIYPGQPRSVKHNDLPSFLRHAERVGLDSSSTTYVGTHYEYTVAGHLAPLGFALRRVGGASDRGIDLLGTWTLPVPTNVAPGASMPSSEPLRVILQCKAGAGQRVGPHLVRELEGAFIGAPVGWKSRVGNDDGNSSGEGNGNATSVIGLLVTEKPATKGIRDALARSRWPMAYVYCPSAGHVRQMLWNQQAEKSCGLTGLGVALRHATDESEGAYTHIVLTWQGKPLLPAPSQDL